MQLKKKSTDSCRITKSCANSYEYFYASYRSGILPDSFIRMQLISNIKGMQSFSSEAKRNGRRIAFVPTMGYLHEGHAGLLRKGRGLGDILVMSIFVNPMQFGPKEDYSSYPRDLKRDMALAQANGVDVVFNPTAEDMYPSGFQTSVDVAELSSYLCGLSRPGHFKGVATVVSKLFNIVNPDVAVFGEKDFQQLTIIKRMVSDLNMDVDVVGMLTVREPDGLAMSSRNSYLSADERTAATCIYKAILKGKELVKNGVRNADAVVNEIMKIIEAEPKANIEYARVCDVNTLMNIEIIQDEALLAMAVRIGKTRLIDNCLLKAV